MNVHDSDQPEKPDTSKKFDVDCNPTGPWATMADESVKRAILAFARRCHAVVSQEQPSLESFSKFLDAFACEWNLLKAKVEEESMKYGFVPCDDLTDVPRG